MLRHIPLKLGRLHEFNQCSGVALSCDKTYIAAMDIAINLGAGIVPGCTNALFNIVKYLIVFTQADFPPLYLIRVKQPPQIQR